MKILAVETSTEYCSVALWQNGSVTDRCDLVGQKHSEQLIQMIDNLLRDEGLKIAELDGIAFGKGPGSFTGVRIACGVAQGLALGADLKVAGVGTLLALAQTTGYDKVVAALDARMGEIYLAVYEKQAGKWSQVIEPCLCKITEAPLLTGDGWFGTGSGFTVNEGALATHFGGQLLRVDSKTVPQAGAIAQLAALDFANGNVVDAALALPLYLRDKVALKTNER